MVVAANTCNIKLFTQSDLASVVRIEQDCFEHPWSELTFRTHLLNRETFCFCAMDRHHVAGYIVFERLEGRIVIHNLAVDPELHGQYIGKSIINNLKHYAMNQGFKWLEAYVIESNYAAQHFFLACHFVCIDFLRGYYLPDHEESAHRFQFKF